MNKLTYQENIGLKANCPNVEKNYRTKAELLKDYEKFKATWMEICRVDPYNHKIDEMVNEGNNIIALTTTIKSDACNVRYTYIKTVEIYFDEQ